MYVVTIGMMLGLRVSLFYNIDLDVDIVPFIFHECDRYVFPPTGSPTTPVHHLSHTFKFKDYAPKVFRQLRIFAGVETKTYLESISGDANYLQFNANSKRFVFSTSY